MKSTILKPRTKKITEAELNEIAELVGTKFLNEKEACLLVGVNPPQWYCWKLKSKNTERFAELTARLKSYKVKTLINRIEDASDPTKVKKADWRAASWLGERLKPESLSLQAAHSPFPASASALDTSRLIDAMTRVYASPAVAEIECRTTEEKPAIECRTTGESQAYAPTPPPRRRV